jgi:pyrroloquinoline quinone biosynthesis protein D
MTEEKQIYTLDYLGFAAGVRLHWSDVRQEHWLLFPEGAIALNSTAVAILTKCNGHRSFEAIALALKQEFSDVNVPEVENFLSQMIKRGLLVNKIRLV